MDLEHYIQVSSRKKVTVQNSSERNSVERERMIQECGNPIVEDDFHGFLHQNCESTEQFRKKKEQEAIGMNEMILQIIAEYMQQEKLLSKEEVNRFQKLWRKGN